VSLPLGETTIMARFQMVDGTQLSSICLDNAPRPDGEQKRIKLQYTAADEIVSGGVFVDVQSHSDQKRKMTPFTVTAKPGAIGKAFLCPLSEDEPTCLVVQVGTVTNHENFTVDLFAELLGRSEDPKKLRAYERALDSRNNDVPSDRKTWDGRLADQPLKQITNPATPQKWNCGAALQSFGTSFFGKFSSGEPSRYYDTPKGGKEEDIRRAINSSKVKSGVDRIQAFVNSKTVVRVFCSHHYPVTISNGQILASGYTHYLSIFGYGSREGKLRFLCIDPWPGGSKLTYTSGILGNCPSAFMGILEFNGSTLETPASLSSGQAHSYLVVAGP